VLSLLAFLVQQCSIYLHYWYKSAAVTRAAAAAGGGGSSEAGSDVALSALMSEHAGLIAGAVGDSNVAAQERGVDAALAFCRAAPDKVLVLIACAVAQAAIDKAFGQSKCKDRAQLLVVALLERDECLADVLALVVAACEHKQPKVAAASAETLRLYCMAVERLQLCCKAHAKALLQVSVRLFASTVAGVRAEALPLALLLFRLLGTSIRRCVLSLPASLPQKYTY
jgi:hypothetical protein